MVFQFRFWFRKAYMYTVALKKADIRSYNTKERPYELIHGFKFRTTMLMNERCANSKGDFTVTEVITNINT